MKEFPTLGQRYVARMNDTLKIVASTETLWLTAPPTSEVRRQLKVPQLEALYEATYLRIFGAWESFLEEALVRFIAGYRTPSYKPVAVSGQSLCPTITQARAAIYGNRNFLLWHDPQRVVDRCNGYLVNCPVATAVTASMSALEQYSAIRHRVAHDSPDAAAKFASAAVSLTGTSYGGQPGRLLRGSDISDPLNQPKWIRRIVDDLAAIVLQVAP